MITTETGSSVTSSTWKLTPAGALFAVGTIFGERPEGTLYFSPTTTERRDGTDLPLEGLALTDLPAQICLEPDSFCEGDLRDYRDWPIPERLRGLVERAAGASRSRSGSDPIEVYDADPTAPSAGGGARPGSTSRAG